MEAEAEAGADTDGRGYAGGWWRFGLVLAGTPENGINPEDRAETSHLLTAGHVLIPLDDLGAIEIGLPYVCYYGKISA